MKTRNISMGLAAVMLTTLLMSGATTTVLAQAAKASPSKMPQHQEGMKGKKGKKGMKDMKDMKDMPGMSGMMAGPHAALAMAYRDNLVTFARTLRDQVNHSQAVNLDLARPAVAEMRRSYEQIRDHHQAQMKTMGDHMNTPMPDMTPKMQQQMPEMMARMESHFKMLNEHLTLLESELNAGTPGPKEVVAHTTEILQECAEMSAMAGKAMPHRMK